MKAQGKNTINGLLVVLAMSLFWISIFQPLAYTVGAAVATAVLISPAGLFLLFAKKRRYFVTIGYLDAEGAEQVAVFKLGKDIIRTALPILETRSGRKIVYQDDEARKADKGN
jgi:hypothetical protein